MISGSAKGGAPARSRRVFADNPADHLIAGASKRHRRATRERFIALTQILKISRNAAARRRCCC
jgi:hypothetical protein